MSEQENGQLAPTKPTARNGISSERWEQIKTAYAVGVGLREIARKMNVPEGTVLAHAKRQGWTQQIQVATRELGPVQSDAIVLLGRETNVTGILSTSSASANVRAIGNTVSGSAWGWGATTPMRQARARVFAIKFL